MKCSSPESYQLMMEGSQVFADMEADGMRVDTSYLRGVIESTGTKIASMEQELKQDEVYATWRKHFGQKANLGSRAQLGKIIFDVMRVPSKETTKTGRPKTDIEALDDVEFPFVRRWVNCEKLKKVRSTNLVGLLREVDDYGFLHPFFNQHLVVTHRSSSDHPNFQNQPNRDPKSAKLIRRAIVPRSEDHILVETDFVGAEVKGATCYHKDPTMLRYIEEEHDLHLDMAAELYKLDKSEVSKPIRHVGKNGFVFPSFYGDWYLSICQALWRAVERDKLTTTSGKSLRQHLNEVGLTELGDLNMKDGPRSGTFEEHVKQVEERFWNERFPVYTRWKEDWWNQYLKRGWYEMLTGFVVKGVYKRNEAINGPVQGVAYHWLLWSLIPIIRWLKKYKMKTRLVAQIHDSLIADVHKDEYQDYMAKVREVMTVDIRKHWPWIITPLAIESEASAVNWFEKKPVLV